MPAPSAQYILSMLNPYEVFSKAMSKSAETAVAAGKAASDSRLGQRQLSLQEKNTAADNARADKYLGLQQQEFDVGQKNRMQDAQAKALSEFQAAVDAGDTEAAALAANKLRIWGVDVEEYGADQQQGAQEQGPENQVAPTPPRTPSVLESSMGKSPAAAANAASAGASAAAAQAKARAPSGPVDSYGQPMSREDQKTSAALDALKRSASVPSLTPETPATPVDESYDPEADALGGAAVRRPPNLPIGNYTGNPNSLSADDVAQLEQGRSIANANFEKKHGYSWDEYQRRAARYQASHNGEMPSTFDLPEDQSGLPPAGSTGSMGSGPTRTPRTRGYRLSFGGQVMDISPETVLERQRGRVAHALGPLLESARTPDEQRAAQQAIAVAVESVGTLKPDEAVRMGLDLYDKPLDRAAREKRARIVGRNPGAGAEGYGGVPGLTEDEKKRSLDVGRYANTIIEKVLEKYNVKGVREQLAEGEDMVSKANSPNSLSQFASKATLQKALMRGALSDRDVARLEAAPGQWSRLESWVNSWTEGGQVPPDILRQIREIAVKKNALLRERLDQAGQAAKERITTDPAMGELTTPEELDEWGDTGYGAATGAFAKRKRKGGAGPVPSGKTGAPAPKKKAGAADDAARRLLGK